MYYFNGQAFLLDDQRLGQLKWFGKDSDLMVFGKLSERIECITEYSTKTAEGYQTVNYGLGGHFSVHVDAFTDVSDFYSYIRTYEAYTLF